MALRIDPILGNSQRLDGGAMFGNAPRALWSRWLEPDEQGRIDLATRAALVRDGERNILLETGIGAFFEPKLKDRFGVLENDHVLLRSLSDHGLSHEDIDVVVLSHLHFDHAGGLLEAYREGSEPKLLFPNAQFVVGQRAWDRAESPHPRDRASFIPGLTQQLRDSGRLTLVPDGETQSPVLPASCTLHLTDGHTPGMLHAWLRGTHQNVFFCADLIPGRPWVRVPITMGYDRFAEALIDEKAEFLKRFDAERTWLFFTHDSQAAMARVALDERGQFGPAELICESGLDLDAPSPAA